MNSNVCENVILYIYVTLPIATYRLLDRGFKIPLQVTSFAGRSLRSPLFRWPRILSFLILSSCTSNCAQSLRRHPLTFFGPSSLVMSLLRASVLVLPLPPVHTFHVHVSVTQHYTHFLRLPMFHRLCIQLVTSASNSQQSINVDQIPDI